MPGQVPNPLGEAATASWCGPSRGADLPLAFSLEAACGMRGSPMDASERCGWLLGESRTSGVLRRLIVAIAVGIPAAVLVARPAGGSFDVPGQQQLQLR